jgi:hypothetical protein
LASIISMWSLHVILLKSKLLYDWRFTPHQLVLAASPLRPTTRILFIWTLSFTIVASPCQRSHSRVQVPRDSSPYFTVSGSRLPQPGGPGPRIYIPPKRVARLYPQALGSHFRRLLRPPGAMVGVYDTASTWEGSSVLSVRVSELLYDWWFTANQFVLAPSPLRLNARIFFQLNTCGNSPYVISLRREDGFVSYEYAWPYNMLSMLSDEVIPRYIVLARTIWKTPSLRLLRV